ncbi:ABC transporter protein [Halomicronema hongdechloris C2206]|uniref:ABC transporter protein n=2 Tax=Halomicronema hongdechloris TaxID=1209493 RepID=A0A1Z3HT82_9CYAN|nr:ABC transporter protein [Halomicronema hongdechloris C2206]
MAPDAMTTSPLLQVANLAFTYIGQPGPTLHDVHLTLQAGELVVLAGATGSGKSTLLNCLTGIAPDHTGGRLSGQVLYRGQDITAWSMRMRSQVMGILLQNVETQLFTDQVWEELVFGLENWNLPPGEIQALAQTALADFDLVAQRHWPIARLSAGQKQRLLLACLLTRQPDLLLLDEPFAFLDTAGVKQLLRLLRRRVQRGQTVVLIEHRLELLQGICDRAYRVEAGTVCPMAVSELAAATVSLPPLTSRPRQVARGPTTPPVLQTHGLSWGGYPAFPDLKVFPGDIVLLQGDNGCGKTTLLKLLSGLLKPSSGRIWLQGREVTGQRVVQRSQTVGFVLQNPNHQLFADSVAAELHQPGVAPAQAQALLQQLNLTPCRDQHPRALSQGQKRQLALGAVLARQPQVCLLDEIMVGQDATSLALMLETLKTFTDQGGALIFTSHDGAIATALAPEIIAIG